MSSSVNILVGARSSALSRAQVGEVLLELQRYHPDVSFDPIWLETTGDRDLTTSLRHLEKTPFFTQQIDEQQLKGAFQIAIHSAKDLPDPLPEGLSVVALTQGIACCDVIVLPAEAEDLPLNGRVGTSSLRREQNIKAFRSDLICLDIRGTIERRLQQLDLGLYEGVVMAESALIRLHLTGRKRIVLPGERAAFQGQLAVVARTGDEQMKTLFSSIDTRCL